jgi:hypothetical protein
MICTNRLNIINLPLKRECWYQTHLIPSLITTPHPSENATTLPLPLNPPAPPPRNRYLHPLPPHHPHPSRPPPLNPRSLPRSLHPPLVSVRHLRRRLRIHRHRIPSSLRPYLASYLACTVSVRGCVMSCRCISDENSPGKSFSSLISPSSAFRAS